jgi:nucleoside-diphosphate-sugar epimerase
LRVLITGSEGVIGRYLVEAWRKKYDVISLDVKPTADYVVDIRHKTEFEAVIREVMPDVVVNLAAQTDPASSFAQADEDITVNLLGTKVVCEAIKEYDIHLIYPSSAAVYGNLYRVYRRPLKEEDASLMEPVSPYGVDKLAAEMYCKLYSSKFGFKTSIFRFGNVYSPYDDHYLLWKLFTSRKKFYMFGGGKMVRDFVYVGDVEELLALAIDTEKTVGRTLNVGYQPLEVKKVVEWWKMLTGWPEKIIEKPQRLGEFNEVVLDISQARSLGWTPHTDMRDGMKECLKVFQLRIEDVKRK